jgi:integrase
MEHKRQRVQFGWLDLKKRRSGPEVWVLRYRETLADGTKRVPSLIVGSIEEYPTKSKARTASMSLLLSINQEKPEGVPVPFGAVIERYLSQELPERNSTASRYRSWLKNYITPKWAECSLNQIKPLAVEDWLKRLSLAPKSKSHLKNLMRVLFNAAMRWELIPISTQPHEPRARKGRFETKTGAESTFGRRISANVGTHPGTLSNDVRRGDVHGTSG